MWRSNLGRRFECDHHLGKVTEIQMPDFKKPGPSLRDLKAGPEQVGLVDFYNAVSIRVGGLGSRSCSRTVCQVRPGLECKDGILFDVRGVLQPAGKRFTQPSLFPIPGGGNSLRSAHSVGFIFGAAMDAQDRW